MNFSFSEIISYWDILKLYFNPLTIIWWGFTGAFAGFLLMLVLLVVLRKKVLIKRQHQTLKVLAYSYMVLLPLWAGYSFLQWFALHGCEKEIIRNIPTYLGEANSAFNLYLKDHVTEVISERHLQLTGHEIIDKTVGYATEVASKTIRATPTEENNIKEKMVNFFQAKFIESDIARKIIIDEIEKNLGKPLLMDKKLTREFLDVKIQDLMEDGVLNTIITKHTNKLFGGFKSNVLLIFVLILLIPVCEIAFAHYLLRKQLPPPIPETVEC